jgi:hypothetical protein
MTQHVKHGGQALVDTLKAEYGIPAEQAIRVAEIVQRLGVDSEPLPQGYIDIKKVGRTFVITEHF